MIYKKGDKYNIKYQNDYFSQCLSMKELVKTLCANDEILTYRNNPGDVIRKCIFTGYSKCTFTGRSNIESCISCKGYLILSKKGYKICPGYTENGKSCILKIIKNQFIMPLKKDMFEL